MSSDFRIDPSTTSTHLDYGENPDTGSRQQGGDSSNRDQPSKTYLEHHPDTEDDDAPKLKARKARKKKRKIAERRTRQNKKGDD